MSNNRGGKLGCRMFVCMTPEMKAAADTESGQLGISLVSVARRALAMYFGLDLGRSLIKKDYARRVRTPHNTVRSVKMEKGVFLEQLEVLTEEASVHENSAMALVQTMMDPQVEMDRITVVGTFGELCQALMYLRLSQDLLLSFLGGG